MVLLHSNRTVTKTYINQQESVRILATFLTKSRKQGPEIMAQALKAVAVLTEDLSLVPRPTSDSCHLPVIPPPGDMMFSSDFHKTLHLCA